jgi:hypothetical protein
VDFSGTRGRLVGRKILAATGTSCRARRNRKTGWSMIPAINMQYVGFQAKPRFREYKFSVREAGSEREFTLSIENEAFTSRRARFQDGPNICSLRLRLELAGETGSVVPLNYQITGAELDEFRAHHSPKPTRNLYTPKKDDDF